MDFKIGDDFDENGNSNEHKMSKKTAIIIVTVVAIVFGLLVFFISNAIFGKKDDDKPAVDTQVKLTDENVQILYKYVAYKNNGYDNDLFLREDKVTNSTFTDQDKLYYALQFVEPEELLYSGERNDKKQKIYIISISRIRDHLQRFFGEDISFSPVDEITYKFSFTINDLGVATLTYSEEEQAYKVVFNKEKELTEEEQEKALVKKVYTELSSATKKPDGTLILNEKVGKFDYICLLACFIGAVCVLRPGMDFFEGKNMFGILTIFVLLSVLFKASEDIILRYIGKKIHYLIDLL